jgi:hypothetical protein
MARIVSDVTLKHRPNLGEEPKSYAFSAGSEVEILQEWSEHYLVRNADGLVFNVRKECVEAG